LEEEETGQVNESGGVGGGFKRMVVEKSRLHSERLVLHLWHGAQCQDHRYANCGEAHPHQPLILKWLASSFPNDGFGQYGTHKEKQRSYEDNDLPWVHVGSVARQLAKYRHYTHLPISFERFRCELNRKKSKFECYGLLATVMDSVPMCSVRFGILRPDPHRVFAGIQPLAFVCNELFLDVGVCILRSAYSLGICRELGIAIFTHAKHRNIILSFDDPKTCVSQL
jgi:hypothetical protein